MSITTRKRRNRFYKGGFLMKKRCPYCERPIKFQALKCKTCRRWIFGLPLIAAFLFGTLFVILFLIFIIDSLETGTAVQK